MLIAFRIKIDGEVDNLKFSCRIDVEFFPFDEQTCDMIFGTFFVDREFTPLFPIYQHLLKTENIIFSSIITMVSFIFLNYKIYSPKKLFRRK